MPGGNHFGKDRSRLRWLAAAAAVPGVVFLGIWLRHLNFTSHFILFSYLQIVGSLLCFTYSANALVRSRVTNDRMTLILALGFILAGAIETVAFFGVSLPLASDPQAARGPLPWMVGRTLLALLLLAAVLVETRMPQSRDRRRDVALAFFVVGAVVYLTAVVFLSTPVEPGINPAAGIPRPWEAAPALLFAVAAVAWGRRFAPHASIFDRALGVALWMNVACHVVMAESARMLDAPFTLAQILKAASYACVLGGSLLDNAQLFEQVKRLAVSDSLTGLGNYRTLVVGLDSELQRSQRTGRPFALLLMDLDGLKQVNDRYGHLVGSRAICRLGDVLRTNSRAIDIAARYGGDEFALVLPEADPEAAERVARRICDRLASDCEMPSLSVSVGVACYPRDGRSIDDLLNAADTALYRMKRHGSRLGALAHVAACL